MSNTDGSNISPGTFDFRVREINQIRNRARANPKNNREGLYGFNWRGRMRKMVDSLIAGRLYNNTTKYVTLIEFLDLILKISKPSNNREDYRSRINVSNANPELQKPTSMEIEQLKKFVRLLKGERGNGFLLYEDDFDSGLNLYDADDDATALGDVAGRHYDVLSRRLMRAVSIEKQKEIMKPLSNALIVVSEQEDWLENSQQSKSVWNYELHYNNGTLDEPILGEKLRPRGTSVEFITIDQFIQDIAYYHMGSEGIIKSFKNEIYAWIDLNDTEWGLDDQWAIGDNEGYDGIEADVDFDFYGYEAPPDSSLCMSQKDYENCDKNDKGEINDPITLEKLERKNAVKPPSDNKSCFDRKGLRDWSVVRGNETHPITRERIPIDWIRENLKEGACKESTNNINSPPPPPSSNTTTASVSAPDPMSLNHTIDTIDMNNNRRSPPPPITTTASPSNTTTASPSSTTTASPSSTTTASPSSTTTATSPSNPSGGKKKRKTKRKSLKKKRKTKRRKSLKKKQRKTKKRTQKK